MNLEFLTAAATTKLEDQTHLPEIIELYQQGRFPGLIQPEMLRLSRFEVNEPPVLMNNNGPVSEAEAVRRIHGWLFRLPVLSASDRRVWTYLSHVTFASYAWSIWGKSIGDPDKNTRDLVLDRLFMRGDGIRRLFHNAIARLWWFGHVTYDSERSDPYELLPVLLSSQDIPTSLLERRYGMSPGLVCCFLEVIRDLGNKWQDFSRKSETIQAIGKDISLLGGSLVLDCLQKDSMKRHLTKIFEARLAS
jgi:hypothetical protein